MGSLGFVGWSMTHFILVNAKFLCPPLWEFASPRIDVRCIWILRFDIFEVDVVKGSLLSNLLWRTFDVWGPLSTEVGSWIAMVLGVFYLHILLFANIHGCPFFLVDELLFRLHHQRCATSGGCSCEQWRMFLQVHWPFQLLFILSLACFCFISSDWLEYYFLHLKLQWTCACLVDLNSFRRW